MNSRVWLCLRVNYRSERRVAATQQLKATYTGYNNMDEPTAAISVAFTPDGSRIVAGYNRVRCAVPSPVSHVVSHNNVPW